MKVLSLFDGISCARAAIDKIGLPVEAYYASEVDSYAIEISKKNWPEIEQVGSVVGLEGRRFKQIDLLIGGSPCQDLSIAKAGRKGLAGERSGLFYEYVRLLKEVKPKYFILENVASMSKEAKAQITEIMGVQPIMIDAALVGAQQRRRLFWTNIPNVPLPEDRGVMLKDVIEHGVVDRDKAYTIDANYAKGTSYEEYIRKHRRQLVLLPDGHLLVPEATKKGFAVAEDGDSVDLSFPTSKTRRGRVGKKAKNIMTSSNIGVFTGKNVRKLTITECERLQGLPDGYTDGADVSKTQRYKTLGNAFNADVIAHILSYADF